MQDKIKHSTYSGTASDIRSKLQQAGYLVSANTLKSWAHRGKLTPVRKEGRHPIYRIADRVHADAANHSSGRYLGTRRKGQPAVSIISITDKGKTITYHAHHMRDMIEPVKQYGMFGEQLDAKKKLHTLTFYTED